MNYITLAIQSPCHETARIHCLNKTVQRPKTKYLNYFDIFEKTGHKGQILVSGQRLFFQANQYQKRPRLRNLALKRPIWQPCSRALRVKTSLQDFIVWQNSGTQ